MAPTWGFVVTITPVSSLMQLQRVNIQIFCVKPLWKESLWAMQLVFFESTTAWIVSSSLCVRPKKTVGQRISLDLSQLAGETTNDFIDLDSYPLHVGKFDHAIKVVTAAGLGADGEAGRETRLPPHSGAASRVACFGLPGRRLFSSQCGASVRFSLIPFLFFCCLKHLYGSQKTKLNAEMFYTIWMIFCLLALLALATVQQSSNRFYTYVANLGSAGFRQSRRICHSF